MSNALTNLLQESTPEVALDGFRARSELTSTDWTPDVPPQEITLRGYQLAAVETFLEYRQGILGSQPGMGKTAVALTVIANQDDRAAVIIPPSIALVWEQEAERLFPHLKVHVERGTKKRPIPDADILVIGDSVISPRKQDVLDWQPKCLFVDEVQRHKNPQAKRANATSVIAEAVRSADGIVGLLTGTLAVNQASEVWMPAHIAGIAAKVTETSGSYEAWINRWCYLDSMNVEKKIGHNRKKSIWIQVPRGAKNPDLLNERLRSTGYIRVERDQVIDMPDKVVTYRQIPGSKEGMKEYNLILNDFENWIKKQGGEQALYRIKGSEKLVQLGKLTEAAGLAKIKAAAEYVADLVEQGEPVVVMAHHKSVVEGLHREFQSLKIKSVKFYGQSSHQEKKSAYERFKSGKVPVFIGNIASAGTGLNLENSSQLVFVQLPWSPGDFVQASDRIFRVTQKRDCTIHVLSVPSTVDVRQAAVLKKKSEVVDAINAGFQTNDDSESVADEVMASLL